MPLPVAPLKRVLRASAAGVRVSDAATDVFIDAVESFARELAGEAAALARAAGRRKVGAEDVIASRRRLRSR